MWYLYFTWVCERNFYSIWTVWSVSLAQMWTGFCLSLLPPQCSTFRPELPDTIPTLEEAVTTAATAMTGTTATKRYNHYWRRRREMKDSTAEEEVILLKLCWFYYSLFWFILLLCSIVFSSLSWILIDLFLCVYCVLFYYTLFYLLLFYCMTLLCVLHVSILLCSVLLFYVNNHLNLFSSTFLSYLFLLHSFLLQLILFCSLLSFHKSVYNSVNCHLFYSAQLNSFLLNLFRTSWWRRGGGGGSRTGREETESGLIAGRGKNEMMRIKERTILQRLVWQRLHSGTKVIK